MGLNQQLYEIALWRARLDSGVEAGDPAAIKVAASLPVASPAHVIAAATAPRPRTPFFMGLEKAAIVPAGGGDPSGGGQAPGGDAGGGAPPAGPAGPPGGGMGGAPPGGMGTDPSMAAASGAPQGPMDPAMQAQMMQMMQMMQGGPGGKGKSPKDQIAQGQAKITIHLLAQIASKMGIQVDPQLLVPATDPSTDQMAMQETNNASMVPSNDPNAPSAPQGGGPPGGGPGGPGGPQGIPPMDPNQGPIGGGPGGKAASWDVGSAYSLPKLRQTQTRAHAIHALFRNAREA